MVALRSALLHTGRRLSDRQLGNARLLLSYLELGRFAASAGGLPQSVPRDTDLFQLAVARVRASRPLYLEFGVYAGRSLRWWAQHLTGPDAALIGFDSFAGLPDDWRGDIGRGHFATGAPPHIADPRVSFVVGWFEQTLPDFRPPEHDQLVVNIDCDIYASTATVLRWLQPRLRAGDLVYFDELPDRDHEMRALREFLAAGTHTLRPLAYARGGVHWLFECTAAPAS